MEALGTLWIWEVPFAIQRIWLEDGEFKINALFTAETKMHFAWPEMVPVRLVDPDGIELSKAMRPTQDFGLTSIPLHPTDSLSVTYRFSVVEDNQCHS